MANHPHWHVTSSDYISHVEGKYLPVDREKMESLSKEMWKAYRQDKVNDGHREFRQRLIDWLSHELRFVDPNGYLVCGGSTVSRCGTVSSDMDLCYVVRTRDSFRKKKELPIVQFEELDVNHFILNRIATVLAEVKGISELRLVDATVPIVKMLVDTKVFENKKDSIFMEVDINCNCVAGVYNSFLLGGLVNFDERLAVLSVILKKWGKNVKVVDEKRFNSYALVLLIVHYLQCGVNPPVLPNLMTLLPAVFDGTLEPSDLTTSIESLPAIVYRYKENTMSVGELALGFFRYYSVFDMEKVGISIKNAKAFIIDLLKVPKGHTSSFYLEEPYDEITVPKNLRNPLDFSHIYSEFNEICENLEKNPSLTAMYQKVNPFRNKRQQRRAEEDEFEGDEVPY